MTSIDPDCQIVQINCVACENTQSTQTNIMMFALSHDGKVFGKRFEDEVWREVPFVIEAVIAERL